MVNKMLSVFYSERVSPLVVEATFTTIQSSMVHKMRYITLNIRMMANKCIIVPCFEIFHNRWSRSYAIQNFVDRIIQQICLIEPKPEQTIRLALHELHFSRNGLI